MNFIPQWMTNFFGNKKGFISRNLLMGNKSPLYIDSTKPYLLYTSIPQAKTVIGKKAKMFSNMEIKCFDKNTGKEVPNDELYKLIQNPNVYQSLNEFLENYKEQEQVYGNQFIYKNVASSLKKFPSALHNISPVYIEPVTSGKIIDQTEINQIILYYNYNEGGKIRRLETSEVLYSKINTLDNPLVGTSPMLFLQKPISNSKLAYDYRNVILKEKGAIGILSTNANKDAMGAIPLDSEERERIENQYRKDYGLSEEQMKVVVTEASMTWQPMTYPTKDLMLFEEVDENTKTMIDMFGMNANLFSSKNQTFENVKNSLIQVYQDTIIPEADKFTQALTKYLFSKEQDNLILKASYEHVAILKQTTNYNDIESLVNTLTNSVQNQLLTAQQAVGILQTELGKYFDTNGIFNR